MVLLEHRNLKFSCGKRDKMRNDLLMPLF